MSSASSTLDRSVDRSVRTGRRGRTRFVCAAAGVAFGVALVACVDPAQDYQDYIARTAGSRGQGVPSDAAAQEASAIDGGFTSSYFVACLPSLAGGNVTKALLFQASLAYVPTEPGSKKGTLDLHLTPLVKAASDLSQTVGSSFGTTTPVPVDADGKFTVDFGPITLPAASNPISTNDVVFSTASVQGVLLRDDFLCDDLFGEITSPQPLTFDGGNYCLFFRHAGPSGAVETVTADQFHCP